MLLCYNSHIDRSVFSTKDGTVVPSHPLNLNYAENRCFTIHCKNKIVKITNLMVVITVDRI